MQHIKEDIRDYNDIKFIVETFCEKVKSDVVLSNTSNDYKKDNSNKSSFEKRIPLPKQKKHFNRWVSLFNENIDDFFKGSITEEIKTRAESVAYIYLQYKLEIINYEK